MSNKGISLQLLSILVILYYLFVYFAFSFSKNGIRPVLKDRLGNILWQNTKISKNIQGIHTYCYYPSKRVSNGTQGEFLIKRVGNLKDCSDWYGVTEIAQESLLTENGF